MSASQLTVRVLERPYILRFNYAASGEYLLSSLEAERVLEAGYPIVSATRNRVVLETAQAGLRSILTPATIGGGPAFEVTR